MTLAAAGGLGLAAGILFGWLWLRLVPWGVHRRFFSAMSGLIRELVRVEEARVFLRLYRTLLGLVARYVGRNLGGTVVASLPLVVLLAAASRVIERGELAFFASFVAAMMVVFLWPAARRS